MLAYDHNITIFDKKLGNVDAGREITAIENEEQKLKVGDIGQIEAEVQHRIRSLCNQPVVFIETQQSKYLDESDTIPTYDDFAQE